MSRENFECNICFDPATDPVVTRCGHLYCWKCLSEWLSRKPDCPVCKGAVVKDECVPLYGRGRAAPTNQGSASTSNTNNNSSSTNANSSTHTEERPAGHRRDPLPQQNGFFGTRHGGANPWNFGGLGGFGFFFLPSAHWFPLLFLFMLAQYYGVSLNRGQMAILFGGVVLFALLFLEL
eukprot:PhF_6_TR35043/c0_g1_i1/m.51063/K10666/RNF5; E3 ubiquitin-protein ligase RNF5